MKTKLCFVADICIRISTYRKPRISEKELKSFKEYANLLAKNTAKIGEVELYYLFEQVTYAVDIAQEDKKLNINFDGLESSLIFLESELHSEILEREMLELKKIWSDKGFNFRIKKDGFIAKRMRKI